MPFLRKLKTGSLAGELIQPGKRTRDNAQVNAAGQAELHGLGCILPEQQFFVVDDPHAGLDQCISCSLAVRRVFRVGNGHPPVIAVLQYPQNFRQCPGLFQPGCFRHIQAETTVNQYLGGNYPSAVGAHEIHVFLGGGNKHLEGSALHDLPGEVTGRPERQVDFLTLVAVKRLADFSHDMSQVGRRRDVQRFRAGFLKRQQQRQQADQDTHMANYNRL